MTTDAPRRPRLVGRCARARATVPEALLEGAVEREDGALLAPLTAAGAEALRRAARRRAHGRRPRAAASPSLERGEDPPPARLAVSETRRRRRFLRLEVLWDPDVGRRLRRAARAPRTGPRAAASTRGSSSRSTRSSPCTTSRSTAPATATLARAARRARRGAERDPRLARDRAASRSPRPPPCSAASSRPSSGRACATRCDARRAFLADEQGLGKTVEALAALEADDAFPAVVVCPASLKLNWERETAQLAAAPLGRGRRGARCAVPPTAEITILNYEVVAAHREALGRAAPARARRRRVALLQEPAGQAHAGGAAAGRDRRRPTALRLALTGTPVLNHAEELISQLRVHRAPGGLRLGRALRAPVPRPAHRGAPALAPAPALLRAPPEVRGAAPAAGQAPGRRAGRARQRARVPAGRGRRHRLAARAAARPRASSTRRSPRRCAPSAWRSSARCSAWPRAASSHAALAWIHDFLASRRAARRLRAPHRGPGGGAGALPATRCTCSAATRSPTRDAAVARVPGRPTARS